MASTVKRIVSGVLAVWFTVFSVVFPVTANAATYNATPTFTGRAWYVPSAGAISGVGAVASVALGLGKLNPWVSAGMVGLSIYQMVVQTQSGANIGIVSGNQLTTPIPGWGNSNTPPPVVASTGSTTTPTVTGYYVAYKSNTSITAVAANHVAACAALWEQVGDEIKQQRGASAVDTSIATASCRYTVGTSTSSFSLAGPNQIQYCPIGTLQGSQCVIGSCPSGYAMTNGQCTLTDTPPVQWPSDGQPTYIPRVGDNGVYQWWPSDRDPDQGTYPQANINAALQSGDIFTDPYGNPVTQTFTPTSDGGYTVQQQIQHSPSGSGNTYTTTNTITVNNAGTVTNASTITNNGPITNVNSAGGAVQPLPTDYNREATQLAVKEDLDKLVAGTGAQDAPDFKTDVESKKSTMDKSITDFTDAIPADFAQSKNNWFSWVWSPPVGECTPYQGSIHGKSVSWNICPYIANVRDVIGWLFALYGAWTVYNQMFKREDA